jgi:hypothetical protein
VNGMARSATQRKIEQQTGINRERYLHKPTGKRYVIAMEAGGTVELEGIDRISTYTSRKLLDNAEVWERLP